MFGFKNDLFTIKIMKGEHLYIYNRLKNKVVIF
jgi:hypothetical protein